jgi:GrpB-like predicted nucleotidyltransferase (UPF0157 family)
VQSRDAERRPGGGPAPGAPAAPHAEPGASVVLLCIDSRAPFRREVALAPDIEPTITGGPEVGPSRRSARAPTQPDSGGSVSSSDGLTHLDAELDAVLIGGREPAVITLVAYDQAWPQRFEAERRRIEDVLGPLARRIEHIGSTSVPGLAAKDIIDILVEVDDPDGETSYRCALEGTGLVLRVREARHAMFRSRARDVHVHAWPTGSDEAADYLILRDWLRTHPADRLLYESTKAALATRSWPDMNYYAEAKGPIIAQIMRRAKDTGAPAPDPR